MSSDFKSKSDLGLQTVNDITAQLLETNEKIVKYEEQAKEALLANNDTLAKEYLQSSSMMQNHVSHLTGQLHLLLQSESNLIRFETLQLSNQQLECEPANQREEESHPPPQRDKEEPVINESPRKQ